MRRGRSAGLVRRGVTHGIRARRMTDIWSPAHLIAPKNEAEVETLLVLPLLAALGYAREDIRAKQPVKFQEGRVGRSPEADFVVYNGPIHSRDTSLLVVEAKAPGEKFEPAVGQAESYAMARAIRAPVILITDAVRLEVWQLQPTLENERVLAINVRDLAAQQGALERLLSKEALRTYARGLIHRRLATVPPDFGAYLAAEHARVSKVAPAANRSLRQGESTTIGSADLLRSFGDGVIIVGPSGFGKSTLANGVFREAVDERIRTPKARLPFEIFLPDLGEEEPVAFVAARLRAHQAGATEAFVRDVLRERGATLVCDGFNRLGDAAAVAVATNLRLLLRDYPKVQLLVLAAEGRSPGLPLETLVLLPLSRDEQLHLVRGTNPQAVPFFSAPPGNLRDLTGHPLLLSLMARSWQARGTHDLRVVPVFQAWLDSLLGGPGAKWSIRSSREAALSAIAQATVGQPVKTHDAAELLRKAGISPEVLDSLEDAGAFRRGPTGSLELVHEALADFLRARSITSGSEEEVSARVAEMPLVLGSWLPILVLLMLEKAPSRNPLWRRAAEADPRVYVSLLAHPSGDAVDGSQEVTEEDVRCLLSDILLGVLDPVRSAFPALEEAVATSAAGYGQHPLAIVGQLSGQRWLSYGFRSEATLGAPVILAQVPEGNARGLDLMRSGLPITGGRLIGFRVLKDALADVVSERALRGGRMWANERLLSDLRCLRHDGQLDMEEAGLEALRQVLLPEADKVFGVSRGFDTQIIPVRRLLDDAERLLSEGIATLDRWWERMGAQSFMKADHPGWPRLIDEHFRRAQILLAEIVGESFPGLRSSLSFHAALPVRFEATLTPSVWSDSGSISLLWRPVSSWEDAGADTTFAERLEWDEATFRAHVERVRGDLIRLGRPHATVGINSRRSVMWNFDGSDLNGRYDGATSALREACEWLQDGLDELTRGSPG